MEVRMHTYVCTILVLERTVRCSQTVQFFGMFDMFKILFWAKLWCSESSMFRHSMFRVFEVQYFGVHSKTMSNPGVKDIYLKSRFWAWCQTSLGMNSSMFMNCSVFCDVRHVWSLILGQNVMFRKFDVWTSNVFEVQFWHTPFFGLFLEQCASMH